MEEQKRKLLHMIDTRDIGLVKLQNLDLSQCNSFSEMAKAMTLTAFGGRALGEAVEVARAMLADKQCLKVLTLSGAMTIAKMNLVICDMIEHGMVDVIIATGALIAHGFIDSLGTEHYKYPGGYSDEELFDMGYDRVYDSLETETNFLKASQIMHELMTQLPEKTCSHQILRLLGKYLAAQFPQRSVLKCAYQRNIPIFIPAFSDSELGMEFYIYNQQQKEAGKQTLSYDPFEDLAEYARLVLEAPKLGIFTIGGGVPRNWAQQIAPLLQWEVVRSGKDPSTPGMMRYAKRFTYGVRICPEPVHWGGLSGCTYSEGVSWGKFVPVEQGGRYAEVLCDATIAWPIIIKALLETMD